jgi:hypothetical protein
MDYPEPNQILKVVNAFVNEDIKVVGTCKPLTEGIVVETLVSRVVDAFVDGGSK